MNADTDKKWTGICSSQLVKERDVNTQVAISCYQIGTVSLVSGVMRPSTVHQSFFPSSPRPRITTGQVIILNVSDTRVLQKDWQCKSTLTHLHRIYVSCFTHVSVSATGWKYGMASPHCRKSALCGCWVSRTGSWGRRCSTPWSPHLRSQTCARLSSSRGCWTKGNLQNQNTGTSRYFK